MRAIQSVAIVGAGAMGAAYAAMFADAGQFSVHYVAGGERFARLSGASQIVNGKTYTIPVLHPQAVTRFPDLVLVALKHHHLAGAVADVAAVTGPETTVLSVMNGLESEEILGAVIGMDKLVYAIAVGIDAVHENGRFTYANPGRIVFGAVENVQGPSLIRLGVALTSAGIPNEIAADIQRTLWWKFMINVGVNQASAVLRAPYGVFHASADARALMRSLMLEVIALAQVRGIDLSVQDLDAWEEILLTLAPEGKTSMLQDVEAKRKTEVEIFAGKVVALGAQLAVPTPVNATILRIIRVMEERFACHRS